MTRSTTEDSTTTQGESQAAVDGGQRHEEQQASVGSVVVVGRGDDAATDRSNTSYAMADMDTIDNSRYRQQVDQEFLMNFAAAQHHNNHDHHGHDAGTSKSDNFDDGTTIDTDDAVRHPTAAAPPPSSPGQPPTTIVATTTTTTVSNIVQQEEEQGRALKDPTKPSSILKVSHYLQAKKLSNISSKSDGDNHDNDEGDYNGTNDYGNNDSSINNKGTSTTAATPTTTTTTTKRAPSLTPGWLRKSGQQQQQQQSNQQRGSATASAATKPAAERRKDLRDKHVVGLKDSTVLTASTRMRRHTLIIRDNEQQQQQRQQQQQVHNSTSSSSTPNHRNHNQSIRSAGDNDIGTRRDTNPNHQGSSMGYPTNTSNPKGVAVRVTMPPPASSSTNSSSPPTSNSTTKGGNRTNNTGSPENERNATSAAAAAKAAASAPPLPKSVEDLEDEARANVLINPLSLLWVGNIAALKVFGIYLITLDTIISCLITAGLICYFYLTEKDSETWNGDMDFVLLAFSVTAPISAAIGMAFTRRERALIAMADFRSFSHHLYMAHCFWDWNDNGGRAGAAASKSVDWVEHCDAVLAQLIGIGDELCRFLTLPNPSRTRHRMTKQGRKEAAHTMEVAYLLLESMNTQRMARLMMYSERIKKIGLPSGELSRMRQYERFISNMIEQLRMIKLYRTPQALRSFGRIFTVILPPFYAPSFAQLAINMNSLGFGVAFGIMTGLCLTALFESVQVLEDPFIAYLALDGIDVREEFEVLHYAQLVNTRRIAFPNARPYPAGRRAALTSNTVPPDKKHLLGMIGLPPVQNHHERYRSGIPSLIDLTELNNLANAEDGGDDDDLTTKLGLGLDENTVTEFDAINDDHVHRELGVVYDGNDGDDDQPSLVRETIFQEKFTDADSDAATAFIGRSNHSRTLSRQSIPISGSQRLRRRQLREHQHTSQPNSTANVKSHDVHGLIDV